MADVAHELAIQKQIRYPGGRCRFSDSEKIRIYSIASSLASIATPNTPYLFNQCNLCTINSTIGQQKKDSSNRKQLISIPSTLRIDTTASLYAGDAKTLR